MKTVSLTHKKGTNGFSDLEEAQAARFVYNRMRQLPDRAFQGNK